MQLLYGTKRLFHLMLKAQGKALNCRHYLAAGDLQLLCDTACHEQGQRLHLLGGGRKDKIRGVSYLKKKNNYVYILYIY